MKTKLLFLILLSWVCASNAHPQSISNLELSEQELRQCKDSLSKVKIRGFQLGMTAADVKKLYPEIKIPYSDYDSGDISKTDIYNIAPQTSSMRRVTNKIIDKGKYTELDGLEALSLTFINYRLTNIFLNYEPNVQWSGASDFAKIISKNLNLPKTWTLIEKDNLSLAKMECGGFGVVAGIGINKNDETQPILVIANVEAANKANELANQRELQIEKFFDDVNELKKKTFKP